jgi:hypothetical protein
MKSDSDFANPYERDLYAQEEKIKMLEAQRDGWQKSSIEWANNCLEVRGQVFDLKKEFDAERISKNILRDTYESLEEKLKLKDVEIMKLNNQLSCSVDSEAYSTLKFATDSTIKALKEKLKVAMLNHAEEMGLSDRYLQKCQALEEKLKVAVEALEYMNTYKHPDYFSHSRGSVFEVAKEALEKIKGTK